MPPPSEASAIWKSRSRSMDLVATIYLLSTAFPKSELYDLTPN